MTDIYLRLAKHLEDLIMGYPYNEALIDLLKEMFNPVEAEVALAIPNNLEPLEVVSPQTITARCNLPESTVTEALQAKILGRTDCHHSLEVCIKYDELAEFVIEKGLARQISKDEAMKILADSEKEGLVHMVDNTQGQIKHTCNCCGHYCWNVGIIRRRKIPRDMLMAVYFIRETDSVKIM